MIVPDYYKEFHCIAGACRHSCCIGWEIDIDEETAARYRALPGEAGERLRRLIAGDPPHFVLDSEDRCPCLTGENLCALILTQGEEALCQICRDHPRFRNEWPDRTEAGLGACCEEAARLILSQRTPLKLEQDDTVCIGTAEEQRPDAFALTDEEAAELLAFRDRLLAAIYGNDCTLEETEALLLRLADTALPGRTWAEWSAFYTGLERLDADWTEKLRELADSRGPDFTAFDRRMADRQQEYRNMLAYFLYRHLPEALDDGDAAGKVAFAVLSCRFLRALGAVWYEKHGTFTLADQTELFRMYSAEIEYSEDNLDACYEELWQAEEEELR